MLAVFVVLAPWNASAQTVQSFTELALRINLHDQVRIEDQSGATTSGRVVRLTRSEMTIATDAGEKRFTSDTVRVISARQHQLRKGALIGGGLFAVLGAVAVCAHEGGANCGVVGALGAAPIGLGVGLAFGALISRDRAVYRAADRRITPEAEAQGGAQVSLLEDLALRINLDDRIQVEDQSGHTTVGRLRRLTDGEITVETGTGDQLFTRDMIRQVAVRRRPVRAGVLIGAGAGVALGAVAACTGDNREECADAPILAGGLGAGLGLAAGALMHRTTVVYPQAQTRVLILPTITRGAIGVRVTRRW